MGGSASKRKGTRVERELVEQALEHGIAAERLWGSNGRSRGLPEEVDIILGGCRHLQSKARKKLPDWMGMTDKVYGVVLDETRGPTYAMIRYTDFLELLTHDPSIKRHVSTRDPRPGGS
jgi:hypothetical protein